MGGKDEATRCSLHHQSTESDNTSGQQSDGSAQGRVATLHLTRVGEKDAPSPLVSYGTVNDANTSTQSRGTPPLTLRVVGSVVKAHKS